MDYKIRIATPNDHDLIYTLKAESVRPYVEKIWGWDEDYQKKMCFVLSRSILEYVLSGRTGKNLKKNAFCS